MDHPSSSDVRQRSENDADGESDIPKFPFKRREHSYDPPEEYSRLRTECPVSHVRLFDGKQVYLVTRSEDTKAALASPQLSALRNHPGYPELHPGSAEASNQRATFVNLDDPEHRAQRSLLEPCFAKEAIESMRPSIRGIVDGIIDEMTKKRSDRPGEPIDLIGNFTNTVPTRVIYSILGLSSSDAAALSQHSEIYKGTSRDAAQMSGVNLKDHIAGVIDQRIKAPTGEDLISYLVKDAYNCNKLDRDDLVELVYTILIAGNAAMTNSIALGVLSLLQHPAQLEWMKQDPSRVQSASNEIFRYHTTSGLNCRRATKGTMRIGDTDIPPNTGVICANQAGDRDPRVFVKPDEFDITREQAPSDSLAFGWGLHRCLAEWLSRAEMEIALAQLFGRLQGVRLAPGVDDERLNFSAPDQNLGLEELKIVWEN